MTGKIRLGTFEMVKAKDWARITRQLLKLERLLRAQEVGK